MMMMMVLDGDCMMVMVNLKYKIIIKMLIVMEMEVTMMEYVKLIIIVFGNG